jgi:hypothetical protein
LRLLLIIVSLAVAFFLLAIALPYAANTDWCRNILAAGKCRLQCHGQGYLLDQPEVVPVTQVVSVFPFSLRLTARANGLTQCLQLRPQRRSPTMEVPQR